MNIPEPIKKHLDTAQDAPLEFVVTGTVVWRAPKTHKPDFPAAVRPDEVLKEIKRLALAILEKTRLI